MTNNGRETTTKTVIDLFLPLLGISAQVILLHNGLTGFLPTKIHVQYFEHKFKSLMSERRVFENLHVLFCR